jgi:hypothetical protein
VFTKYISRLKEHSKGSPSVSKSVVDSDAGVRVQAVEPLPPSQVPCTQEAADDDAYNMDFNSNTDTEVVGKTVDVAPLGTLKAKPSTAAIPVPEIPTSAPKAAPRKNPEVPSRKSHALQSDT